MNEELIKQLMNERDEMFPYGCPIQPRGCSKTYTYLALFLRWNAYNFMCQIYKHVNGEITLEDAHKDIDDYVVGLMPD